MRQPNFSKFVKFNYSHVEYVIDCLGKNTTNVKNIKAIFLQIFLMLAMPQIAFPELINAFCDDDFYKNDYQEITNYFSDDYVAYEDTIEQMRKLAEIIERLS